MKPRAALILALVVAVPGGAWARATVHRHDTERRAAAVASALTHRSIAVRCPGVLRRRALYEIHEGSVRFDADGVPADETRLSARTCDGLRDVTRAGGGYAFACLASATCAPGEERAAEALAVLAHEIMHLRGTMDEGRAECLAHGRVADVARRLGVAGDAAARLAAWQAGPWQERLPPQYRGAAC